MKFRSPLSALRSLFTVYRLPFTVFSAITGGHRESTLRRAAVAFFQMP